MYVDHPKPVITNFFHAIASLINYIFCMYYLLISIPE